MTEQEIWKDIPDFEGLYQVSTLGNVKNLSRQVKSMGGLRTIKERIISKRINTSGYYLTSLNALGIQTTHTIHKLVAMAFLGHTPDGLNGLVVDHIDNNKLNNRLSNLQLVTQRVNASKDQDKTKTSSRYIGVHWVEKNKQWMSRILVNGKRKYLGSFTKETDAKTAYQIELDKIT